LTLSDASSFTGLTTINAGSLTLAGSYNGSGKRGSGSQVLYASAWQSTFAGTLSGAGGLTVQSGSLYLTSAGNALSGPVGVTGGTLAAASGALPSVGTLNVSGGLLKVVDLSTAASLSLGLTGSGSAQIPGLAEPRLEISMLIRQPGLHGDDGHDHVGLAERDG
jgi:autotransporter-associated beta strand protein